MDRVLEDVVGHALYSFMDGFSGYNQVDIYLDDKEKIAFVTPWGTYIYNKMPFGLCNAPATFQHLVTTIFKDLLLTFLRVFMDDFSNFSGPQTSTCVEAFFEHLQLSQVFARCRSS